MEEAAKRVTKEILELQKKGYDGAFLKGLIDKKLQYLWSEAWHAGYEEAETLAAQEAAGEDF
jgi:hypothetical protein